jgi:acyl-CoA hydrolase
MGSGAASAVRAALRAAAPASYSSPMTSDAARGGHKVATSATQMAQLVLPQHANVHGTVLGGTVMHWIDLAAAVVANRHCRCPVVTAAIDEMSFLAPIQIGQLALLDARMTVDRSSMEIRVDVQSEDLLTGRRRHTSTAYVTFVALDTVTGRPTPVPPLILETEEERREHARALERRRVRLERRRALQATTASD